MIERSLPDIPRLAWALTNEAMLEAFEEAQTKILPIISLLKMMQAKDDYDAFHHTLTFLEALCEKSPDRDGLGLIQLVASGHKSYPVTALALRLLEEIETSLGSTLQEIESIEISIDEFCGGHRSASPCLQGFKAEGSDDQHEH